MKRRFKITAFVLAFYMMFFSAKVFAAEASVQPQPIADNQEISAGSIFYMEEFSNLEYDKFFAFLISIKDEDGNRLENVRIDLYHEQIPDKPLNGSVKQTVTDKNGKITFMVAPSNGKYKIIINHSGYQKFESKYFAITEDSSLEIILKKEIPMPSPTPSPSASPDVSPSPTPNASSSASDNNGNQSGGANSTANNGSSSNGNIINNQTSSSTENSGSNQNSNILQPEIPPDDQETNIAKTPPPALAGVLNYVAQQEQSLWIVLLSLIITMAVRAQMLISRIKEIDSFILYGENLNGR